MLLFLKKERQKRENGFASAEEQQSLEWFLLEFERAKLLVDHLPDDFVRGHVDSEKPSSGQ